MWFCGNYLCFFIVNALGNIFMFFLVTRVMRVISQPRGNMLLVGIGGSGRQSITKLATYMCDYLLFQVEVTKQYRKQEFREGTLFKIHDVSNENLFFFFSIACNRTADNK